MISRNTLFIYANSSEEIGAGHAMRCLSLAQEWMSRGRKVCLVYERSLDWVLTRYRDIGSEAKEFQCNGNTQEFLRFLYENQCFTVFVDSYDVSLSLLNALYNQSSFKVAMMDDVAHRGQYPAHMIINQNPYAKPSLYTGKVADKTKCLLGSEYSLIRDEFLNYSFTTNGDSSVLEPKKMLVSLGGGGDLETHLHLLKMLEQVIDPNTCECVFVSSVLNESEPSSKSNVKILPSQNNFQAWIDWADLALTAAGSSLWELFYASVPCATCIIADNQMLNYIEVSQKGLAFPLGDLRDCNAELAIGIKRFLSSEDELLSKMSKLAHESIDGKGRVRIADEMEKWRLNK